MMYVTVVFGINRNILECKVLRDAPDANRVPSGINRNILECKGSSPDNGFQTWSVLIETYWNVKSGVSPDSLC